MKGLNHQSGIAIVVLIGLLAIAGCQSVAKVQPTATPTETVVVERETNCPVMDLEMLQEPMTVNDPALGETYRANIVKAAFTCPEPYMKGKIIAIQDFIPQKDGTDLISVFEEIVTDESGVWKTRCEGMSYDPGTTNRCTWIGEGLYKGLQSVTEYNNDTSNVKLRITKLAGEQVQPIATPTGMPTAIVVTEGEGQCSITDMKSVADGIPVIDPELGEVVRAQITTYAIDCGNPYVTYKCSDVQDTHNEGDVLHFTSSVECITNEGGVWKGTCEAAIGEKTVCTNKGDGKYKGLQLYTDADLNTLIMKYRITKLAEE